MLRSMIALKDYGLKAKDGEIGSVDEFYFDDRAWTTRYMVANTKKWMPGRQVLISPKALSTANWSEKNIPVELTKKQIEGSPGIMVHEPISRVNEKTLSEYYNWPTYWTQSKSHLQSTHDVMGYKIMAVDGEIGRVHDFIIDDSDWRIRYMVVDTGEWLPHQNVLLSLDWIDSFAMKEKTVHIGLTREQIKHAKTFDNQAPISRSYEKDLYDFYGKPAYWAK